MRSIGTGRRLAALILVLAVPAVGVAQDADTEEEAATEESTPTAVEEPIELEAQTVTGSRLATGDATARVYSITAEDIKRLGVSNVEELMRRRADAHPALGVFVDYAANQHAWKHRSRSQRRGQEPEGRR